ncbi:MAG: flagellar motor protein MotB [Gammaproteobacteria bacterium]
MSEKDDHKPYVIRRIKKIKKGGHHGGSWKIAYADFVTAMMAFFLLMWLLSLANKYQLDGLAEYFKKPLKEAFTHSSNAKNKDKDKDKNKEKEKGEHKGQGKETALDKPIKPEEKKHNEMLKQDALVKKPNDPTELAEQKKQEELKKMNDMQAMKKELEKNLQSDPKISQFKNQLNFVVTADGLRIELHDLKDKPMFSTGKTDFQKYSSEIVTWLSHQLNAYPNRLLIIGHTDAAQYQGDDYSNWELSVDRANATRRELIKTGMGRNKILRIVGVGDTDLLNKNDGLDPKNRRIEIIVLTDDAMKKMQAQ